MIAGQDCHGERDLRFLRHESYIAISILRDLLSLAMFLVSQPALVVLAAVDTSV